MERRAVLHEFIAMPDCLTAGTELDLIFCFYMQPCKCNCLLTELLQVEDCAVMCYGISKSYKESTNCRMEAQYAFQQHKDMVPLMLEEGYRANGWLGMLIGVRMWFAFFGTTLSSDSAFEEKVEELCFELGERGQQPTDWAAQDQTVEMGQEQCYSGSNPTGGGESLAAAVSVPPMMEASASLSRVEVERATAETPSSRQPFFSPSTASADPASTLVASSSGARPDIPQVSPLSESFYLLQLERERAASERVER